jgi:hypothetical protein
MDRRPRMLQTVAPTNPTTVPTKVSRAKLLMPLNRR